MFKPIITGLVAFAMIASMAISAEAQQRRPMPMPQPRPMPQQQQGMSTGAAIALGLGAFTAGAAIAKGNAQQQQRPAYYGPPAHYYPPQRYYYAPPAVVNHQPVITHGPVAVSASQPSGCAIPVAGGDGRYGAHGRWYRMSVPPRSPSDLLCVFNGVPSWKPNQAQRSTEYFVSNNGRRMY